MGDWGCKITTFRAFDKTNETFSAIILHFVMYRLQLLGFLHLNTERDRNC